MWLLGSRLLSGGSECSEVLSRLLGPHFVSRMCQSTSEALDFLHRTAEEGPASTPSEHGDPGSQKSCWEESRGEEQALGPTL